MKPDEKPIRQSWLLRYLPRLMIIMSAVVGWFLGHWSGVAIGFFIGCAIGVLAWAAIYFVLAKSRRTKRFSEIASLSDEDLKKIGVDPTHHDFGYAIMELDRRGITVRPSIKTLFELLLSPNPNRRAIGYSNLGIMYPKVFKKFVGEGTSSSDSPEVWQQRITAFKEPK
jgi:hypothetical protein